jgi:beta-N-acetylhexosaminidase
MDAIDRRFGVGRAAVLAVIAGADMVLIPWRVEKKEEVRLALLEAARSGELPLGRVDEAVRRILHVKISRGLYEALPPLEERLASLGEKRELAGRIASAGVTLLRSKPGLFPLPATRKVAVISTEASFISAMAQRFPHLTSMQVAAIPPQRSRTELKLQARALAQAADVVVVGVTNSRQLELVTNAALAGRPVITVVLGNPYLAAQTHESKVVLATYSYREAATEAAVAAIAGEKGTPGRLPVTLPRLPFGHGLDPLGHRLASKGAQGGTASGAP